MKLYFKNLLLALDQLLNVLLGGYPDETLSSRFYRLAQKGCKIPMVIVDKVAMLFKYERHCERAYKGELLDHHLPPEMRKNK